MDEGVHTAYEAIRFMHGGVRAARTHFIYESRYMWEEEGAYLLDSLKISESRVGQMLAVFLIDIAFIVIAFGVFFGLEGGTASGRGTAAGYKVNQLQKII